MLWEMQTYYLPDITRTPWVGKGKRERMGSVLAMKADS